MIGNMHMNMAVTIGGNTLTRLSLKINQTAMPTVKIVVVNQVGDYCAHVNAIPYAKCSKFL